MRILDLLKSKATPLEIYEKTRDGTTMSMRRLTSRIIVHTRQTQLECGPRTITVIHTICEALHTDNGIKEAIQELSSQIMH